MSTEVICPVCNQQAGAALLKTPVPDGVVSGLIAHNVRGWKPGDAICLDCLSRMTSAKQELEALFPQFEKQEIKILPTAVRLEAPVWLKGNGVTIAFLDSGFYSHPDLTQPANRILKYVNLIGRERAGELAQGDESSWHGMMTSVVAAGNGWLSGGLYRGIASEAKVVLVKIGSASRIKHEDIMRGLRWVIRNRERFKIRIVNISAGGDREASYLSDPLSEAAEEASRVGLVVIAAAGNAGSRDQHPVLPPASAPSVITVGGLDDKNNLEFQDNEMYNSSFGPTIDGLQKPEVIAPGIWVAAPILPGTVTAEQASLLSELSGASDQDLRTILKQHPGVDAELDAAAELAAYLIRHLVAVKMADNKVISGYYKHVDGTSFAAPIVSSIAAQILEANPRLSPSQVKFAIVKTAVRLPGVDTDRQGWGMVNPTAAVQFALTLGPAAPEMPNRR